MFVIYCASLFYLYRTLFRRSWKDILIHCPILTYPTTKSKIIFFVSSTFTDTQAERNHLMKGMFDSDSGGSRIFPKRVRQLPNWNYFANFFAVNCMKMKEFGPPGGVSLAPPLRSTNVLSTETCRYVQKSTSSSHVLVDENDSKFYAEPGLIFCVRINNC